jgi:hypothetical protein
MERVTFTEQMIKECEEDEQLCLVAFGQEEDRDIRKLIGRTVEFKDNDYLCVFDDDFGNVYGEVIIDGDKYNIPTKYFEDC